MAGPGRGPGGGPLPGPYRTGPSRLGAVSGPLGPGSQRARVCLVPTGARAIAAKCPPSAATAPPFLTPNLDADDAGRPGGRWTRALSGSTFQTPSARSTSDPPAAAGPASPSAAPPSHTCPARRAGPRVPTCRIYISSPSSPPAPRPAPPPSCLPRRSRPSL